MLSKLQPIKTFHRVRKHYEVEPKRGNGNAATKQWHADTVFFNLLFLLFYLMLEMFPTFQDTLQLLSIFGAIPNRIPARPPFFFCFSTINQQPKLFCKHKSSFLSSQGARKGSHTTLNLSSVLFESSAYSE